MMPALLDGRMVAERVREARSFAARLAGWMGRAAVPADEALYLPGCASVHTCFMRTPIDVLFLDRAGTVLAVRAGVPPWRLAVHVGAWAVMELAPGRARALGIAAGARLRIESPEVA